MQYSDFLARTEFSKTELVSYAHSALIVDPPKHGISQLPAPPFLMFDRILELSRGNRGGRIVAEKEIHFDDWYFQCHFRNDPVQPGCLGVDAVWQLLGFFCSASGATGSGRALGCGEVEFFGQIRPFDRIVRYELDVRRFSPGGDNSSAIGIADAKVFVDNMHVYTITKAKAGIFREIAYEDYPNPEGKFSTGGLVRYE
jgi:3-hydroxyacyl-[acyl-carrier protein] dehydratase/trans-2-decenoyl-[acyl-carrier protein] isomerase